MTNTSLETAITSWVWDMYERKVFVSDELIQEKARRIQILLNEKLPLDNQIHLKFSNGWIQKRKPETILSVIDLMVKAEMLIKL